MAPFLVVGAVAARVGDVARIGVAAVALPGVGAEAVVGVPASVIGVVGLACPGARVIGPGLAPMAVRGPPGLTIVRR